MKGLVISLLLLSVAFTQTNFNNTCQASSLLPLMATGVINLNPQDTYNGGANKDFYRDLTINQFQQVDVLGYAFALSGFQAACNQTYYTLVIDKVAFENQNTRMRITVNFLSSVSGTVITNWKLVSFTYIIVSRNFQNTFSNVWASVAQANASVITTVSATPAAIDQVASIFQLAPAKCGVYADPNYEFGTACAPNTAADTTDAAAGGGQLIIHAYIMGFQWNSQKSTTYSLAASVFTNAFANMGAVRSGAAEPLIQTGAGFQAAGWTISAVLAGPNPKGPLVYINNYGGALEYIKVGFVYSRYDRFTAGTINTAAASLYKTTSLLTYSSSYVFTLVTTFNTSVPITRGLASQKATATNWNQYYMQLPDARYAIYGLSSFALPINSANPCSSNIWINATLNSIDTYTVNSPNYNPTYVYLSADIFTNNVNTMCTSLGQPLYKTEIGKKSYFTVPTQSQQQFILQINSVNAPTSAAAYLASASTTVSGSTANNPVTGNALKWDPIFLQFTAATNGNNDTVIFNAEIPFIGLTAGAPIKFEFGYFDPAAYTVVVAPAVANPGMVANTIFTVTLTVNGFTLYSSGSVTSVVTPGNQLTQIFKGLNINSTTANAVITVTMVRNNGSSQALHTYLLVSQYFQAYDPNTGCCVSGCPADTGLNVVISPPTCVYCNTQAGLFYNPANGSCTCLSGFYLDSTKTMQCYPCTAQFCAVCNPLTPTNCTTCVTGALINNVSNTCTCGTGYFVNGTVCQVCPTACQTCTSPLGACTTCVDTQHRDITQNCKCITGYYDSGAANCSACSSTCLRCENGTSCTSCDPAKFRNLTGLVCSCITGYYELYNADGTRTCQLCAPQCLTCLTAPTSCTSCNPAKNRVSGVDSSGRPTCLCLAGYYSTPDGSCVQSNCNADPFCSQCQQGLKLCIQCLASKNRIIQLPASICVCMDGYYADANNNCVACQTGCSVCSSATNCTSCVPLATPNSNGSCSCPGKTYFAISPQGTRYCAACGPYCNVCTSSTTCTSCLSSFTQTADGQCVCSTKNYINSANNCVPCSTGCQACTSATLCSSCINPLVLQGTVCQPQCNNGFTAVGSVCQGCPTGCLSCTQNFICFYCADGLYMYNGNCYAVCPAGTIGDSSTGNWVCEPCNFPCKTCMNHPSYCTSCENGQGYLQSSAVQQSCVQICNDGTYQSNGVCQICDFTCATCLGTSSNCISCPAGQILYGGGCWATCPAILLSGSSGSATCVSSCPAGYYNVSISECAPCSPQCTTCQNGPNNCTSCLQGSVATDGTCTILCGENQFSFQGICIACSVSCYGCSVTPSNCKTCAQGYVQSGSICQRGCQNAQFYDTNTQKCVNCPNGCAKCSSFNYCTSCQNTAITPRGGVCSNCPYPCSTCDGAGVCTSCLSGFYYFQNSCQTTCPFGASPVNGICRCNSGITSNGQCVASCGQGFTSIKGTCVACNSNCAQCAGSVNICTSCISGYTLDASSQTCISNTQCPYGQQSSNGICENICDNGFYFYEGICIYGGCFDGYVPNGNGGCIRSSSTIKSACSTGQFLLNSNCVANCGSGYYPDSLSGRCLACSANCVACFSASFCFSCQSGFQSNSGICVASTSCASSQLQYGSACLASCPVGTFQIGSQCTRSCPSNTYYSSQICYINCPSGLRTNEACVASCPVGTTNKNGICS